MSRTSASKAKLQRLEDQKREREARANSIPEEKSARAAASPTSFLLPNWLLADLQTTKLHLQVETEDRQTFTVSSMARAALHHYANLEMDAQIELIEVYAKAEARAAAG